jgi:uncharacterized protein
MASSPPASLECYFRTYATFLKKCFGEPVFRISVNAGFSCPNRDGTVGFDGCIYCNNESFSPTLSRRHGDVSAQLSEALVKRRRKKGSGKSPRFIVYFQPYTNTHCPVEILDKLCRDALSVEGCAGLAIGTRPDAVDEEKIALLAELARDTHITIEYGLQSIHEESLRWMNRGHTYQAFIDAVKMCSGKNIHIGSHIILGIPGETREMMLETARELSSLPIDFLKIHQLQIIRNTPLEGIYRENPFPLWNLDHYADFLCDFIEELREDLIIQRLYSLSRSDLLIGPQWGRSKNEIEEFLQGRIRAKNIRQGKRRREMICND